MRRISIRAWMALISRRDRLCSLGHALSMSPSTARSVGPGQAVASALMATTLIAAKLSVGATILPISKKACGKRSGAGHVPGTSARARGECTQRVRRAGRVAHGRFGVKDSVQLDFGHVRRAGDADPERRLNALDGPLAEAGVRLHARVVHSEQRPHRPGRKRLMPCNANVEPPDAPALNTAGVHQGGGVRHGGGGARAAASGQHQHVRTVRAPVRSEQTVWRALARVEVAGKRRHLGWGRNHPHDAWGGDAAAAGRGASVGKGAGRGGG
mmetsp:Transcript_33285/g.106194  ORF Transcript_33285/g.106194 Transcript_33285/m.106194 type:complete len:270 (+) Transcript_33285:269-1078(+)